MAIYNLLVKDTLKKECQVYFHLSADIEELFTHNVSEIVRSGKTQIQLETIDQMDIPEELFARGWKRNEGLYDMEIIEYNQKHPEKPLKRWR